MSNLSKTENIKKYNLFCEINDMLMAISKKEDVKPLLYDEYIDCFTFEDLEDIGKKIAEYYLIRCTLLSMLNCKPYE